MGKIRAIRASALARVTLFLIAIAGVFPQHIAAQTPTPAQLETFRNLPPDQQRALMEAMGVGGGSAVRRDPQLSTTDSAAAQQQALRARVSSPADFGPTKMAPGSTVLLDVNLRHEVQARELAKAAVAGQNQSAGQAQAPSQGQGALSQADLLSSAEITPPDPERLKLLTDRRDRIRQGNPYRLDEQGRIALPVGPPVNLTGLTDLQAAQLLNADPRLDGLHFVVTLLPVEPTGSEGLKPFGYDLFDQPPSTFAPAADIPVPSDYRIGPGDNVNIELFGKRTGRYLLVVDRSGALTLPEFGPIQVSGLSFDAMREEIEQRVAEQMIGVRASVTMGQLRTIRVFVVGDVVSPGSYVVSGLSSITNALFASGGVSSIGSLRNIELKRSGKTIARLDLYDLLLRGDTSQDRQLQQGDAIFVPPVGSTAGIGGQVRRPAIYELRGAATVADLIELAGGLKPEADSRLVRLERIDASRERTVLTLDLSKPGDRSHALMPGDLLTIPQVLDDTRGVTLTGHVHRPGAYAWREGMRLSDLLGTPAVFKLNADQRYVVVRREHAPGRRIEVISADAVRAFEAPGTEADPLLQSRDRVIVFNLQADRGPALAELLQELRMQARDNNPLPIVTINGRVRAPGEYPLEPNMTVSDLIRAGGGLDDAAYAGMAELTRYEVVNGESRKTEVIELNLAGQAALGDGPVVASGSAINVRPYDVLVVKETPDWREQEAVTLRGEVRFPGTYPIRRGERLSSVIERAGGLTDGAFAKGAAFMREDLKAQERQQIASLANRMQSDLAIFALQSSQTDRGNSTEMLAVGQSLLSQLKSAEPTGRLVINLERALRRNGSEDDVELRHGDELVVPRFKPYVTVIGEVQNSTSHVWKRDLDRGDYIALSGGMRSRADAKRIYVVRADGSVVASGGSRWFGGGNARIEPGDTIVVPVDAERMRPLPLWTAVTTIIYNLAVAVAAVNSF